MLVRFDGGSAAEAARVAADHGLQLQKAIVRTGFFVLSAGSRPLPDVHHRLAADRRVAVVEPNHERRASAVPDDVYYASAQASYLETIRLPAAWDVTTGAGDLVLAVVDSGVELEHPDLDGRLLPGHDFVNDDDVAHDDFGHGTQVATIAAATANNRTGMAGVAWQGKVLPVKVLDSQGRGNDGDIAAGIIWAADHGADVINLSFGAPQPSQTLAAAVNYARSRDAVVVSAAGNAQAMSPDFPAALDGVIAVSATDRDGRFAWFSNYGPTIDVAAPGMDILAGTRDGPYQRMQGTSYAAPLVAGVALLVRARFPAESADGVIARIRRGARDAGPLGIDDYYGYGLVDALGALGGPAPAPRMESAAATLHEPDNTPDRASPLVPGTSGTIAPEGDVDWYFTDVPSARWLTFTVVPPTSGGARRMDAVLELYGPGLRLMERADRTAPGGKEEITTGVGSGRYYLRVGNFGATAGPGPYQVSLSPAVDPNAPVFRFPSTETRSVPAAATAVAIGDLTGDGASDVLVGTEGGGPAGQRLFLFRQAGGAVGGPEAVATVGSADPESDLGVTLGDVDGDGDLDAAVATAAGIEIHHQSGGELRPGVLVGPARASQVKIGDVDGDGRNDLVVAIAPAGVRLLRNRGDGGYDTSTVTTAATPDIEVADLNGDGRHDLAAWECGLDKCEDVVVYTSLAGGGFARGATIVNGGLAGFSLGLGDWTGDGRPDVVVSNGNIVGVLAQRADGTFPVNSGWSTGNGTPVAVAVADMHGDARDDIVVLYGGTGEILVNWDHDSGRLFSSVNGAAHAFGSNGLAVGDIDSDGLADVGIADRNLGLVTLRRSTQLDPGPQDPGGERLWVRDTTPADGSTGSSPAVTPALRFARSLDPASVTPASVSLLDGATGDTIPAGVGYEVTTNSVVLHPHAPLLEGRPYQVRVSGLKDTDGYVLPTGSCCFRFLVGTAPLGGSQPPSHQPAGPATAHSGYWMLGAGGAVYPFGDAGDSGNATSLLAGPGPTAVDLEPMPSGGGYWILDSAGHVFGFGAPYHGGVDAAALRQGESITSLSATPSGRGYWIFTTAGRGFAFGDAVHLGDMGGTRLNGPVLDSIATPSGDGYYMVASDGGIFAFGDARFFGSMGGKPLNRPVESLVPDPDGAGYWLVASDGGVFAFEAGFRGSMGGKPLNQPVTGMVAFGNGYLMVATDGGIFNFSDRPFAGSLGSNPPSRPIVAVAALTDRSP